MDARDRLQFVGKERVEVLNVARDDLHKEAVTAGRIVRLEHFGMPFARSHNVLMLMREMHADSHEHHESKTKFSEIDFEPRAAD